MKKAILLAAVFMVFAASLFGAEGVDNSVTYRNIKVYKVYAHPEAYVVMYYTNGMDLGQVTLPTKWFKSGAGKGILNTFNAEFTPYMTLQYKEGTFTKVVLNMPSMSNGLVWEHLNQTVDISAGKQKDTLTLE
ncbi:hypothetical protein H0R92_11345 [Treponema sp. OMZ 840]|uniref:hypothetical protein n=1 Tax=Treponema sp. OMZ 840 TaxID=244313 RepID=UPI003D9050BF